jgi:quercetin dioxygenase-like cupin family protein
MTDPIALGERDGEAIWFLGNLAVVKAARETTGGWAMVEVTARDGYQTPRHVHHEEDEVFYILEGLLNITMGDESFAAGPGTFVLSPVGIPHAIKAEGETRWLQLAPRGGFVEMIREIGAAAKSPTLPEMQEAPDFGKLREQFARHGIEMLGEGGEGVE